jgi:hypothetical protein
VFTILNAIFAEGSPGSCWDRGVDEGGGQLREYLGLQLVFYRAQVFHSVLALVLLCSLFR